MRQLQFVLGLVPLIFLASCVDQQALVIPNAQVREIGFLVRDYAGLQGFHVNYANESATRASFRVYIGSSTWMVPGEVETTYNRDSSGHHVEKRTENTRKQYYGYSSRNKVRTISRPAERLVTEKHFYVQLSQKGDDVAVFVKSSGGYNFARYLVEFERFLVREGLDIQVVAIR